MRQPYLSVVVTSRNDDHGGNCLQRTQLFLDCLCAQVQRFKMPTELIMVEWNPPTDRPGLHEALRWPHSEYLKYLIVTVPPEVHGRYKYAAKLPLYQMLAKNVGIRRAKGEYILATNIDVIFSDGLMGVLAGNRLETGKMYRTDRLDVSGTILEEEFFPAPVTASGTTVNKGQPKPYRQDAIKDVLEFCAQNVIYVNSRHGTFTPDKVDIPRPPHVQFGDGWSQAQVEGLTFTPMRCIADVAKLKVGFMPHSLLRFSGESLAPEGSSLKVFNGEEKVADSGEPKSHPEVLIQIEPEVKELRIEVSQPLRVYGLDTVPDVPPMLKSNHISMAGIFEFLEMLHVNGCGDFTLLHRDHWHQLRGYAEWDCFSIHLDSLFCYRAFYSGLEEVLIAHPFYHIDHGGGWTPSTRDACMRGIQEKGIPSIDWQDVIHVADLTKRWGPPDISGENWGLWGLSGTAVQTEEL